MFKKLGKGHVSHCVGCRVLLTTSGNGGDWLLDSCERNVVLILSDRGFKLLKSPGCSSGHFFCLFVCFVMYQMFSVRERSGLQVRLAPRLPLWSCAAVIDAVWGLGILLKCARFSLKRYCLDEIVACAHFKSALAQRDWGPFWILFRQWLLLWMIKL